MGYEKNYVQCSILEMFDIMWGWTNLVLLNLLFALVNSQIQMWLMHLS
jgi:hypothetical protein